jgi:hypothetical protein
VAAGVQVQAECPAVLRLSYNWTKCEQFIRNRLSTLVRTDEAPF